MIVLLMVFAGIEASAFFPFNLSRGTGLPTRVLDPEFHVCKTKRFNERRSFTPLDAGGSQLFAGETPRGHSTDSSAQIFHTAET